MNELDLHLEDPAEGWYVVTSATPTPEEQSVIDANTPKPESTTPPTPEQMQALQAVFSVIATRSRQSASAADADVAQSIYESHSINGAELIQAVITIPDGRGIINCRVDGEHKQVRF